MMLLTLLPQEILEAIVDFVQHKRDLESLSLTHSRFLPRSRWHLFSVIRLCFGRQGSSLSYGSSVTAKFARRHVGEPIILASFLAAFQSAVSQNPLIVSSVRILSLNLHAGSNSRDSRSQFYELPDPDSYLPFSNLQALQVRFAHSHYDIIDVRTTQKWRLPRLIRLIQMNSSSLQHLAIDTCSLEGASWDATLSTIAGLNQLHTLVLRIATIASNQPVYEPRGSFLLGDAGSTNSTPGTPASNKATQPKRRLRRLYLEDNEPEVDREAISTEKYFSLADLDALGFKCHPTHNMWGLRAVLLNVGQGLTSLTVHMDISNSIEMTFRDVVFPNLERFQLISSWLDRNVYALFDWLVYQSMPNQYLVAHPTFDHEPEEYTASETLSKLTKLRFIHLTFEANQFTTSSCSAADLRLINLISVTPSLEQITADITMREYGMVALTGDECLEKYFPRMYATGKLRHGKVDKWWEAK